MARALYISAVILLCVILPSGARAQASPALRVRSTGDGPPVVLVSLSNSRPQRDTIARMLAEHFRVVVIECASASHSCTSTRGPVLGAQIDSTLRRLRIARAAFVAIAHDVGAVLALAERVPSVVSSMVFLAPLTSDVEEGAHLERVSARLLLLVGGVDTTSALRYVDFLNRRVNGSLKLQIPGASHDLAKDAPEIVGAAIVEFLRTP